jgi:hypothetical protein
MASAYPPTGSQPPSVELTVRQGPQPGQRFALTQPTITIGREAGNDVVVSDPQISRRHASLTWDGRQFIIQDLGSANGTFVNGVRLTAPQVLQPGDVIGLGPTVLLGFQALPVAPAPPPAYAPRPPARRRRRFLIPLAALLGLCFILVVAAVLGYFFLWPRPDVKPLVLINSPRHGEQVEVGQEVTVHSIARDESKVIRVELWVDGQLQESQTSSLTGGSSPFPLLARWRPSSPGTHTLIARAFNARGAQGQASVNVEAMELGDRDGDGVADEEDLCLDEPGSELADGCPDRDGDGVPDMEDACPDEPSLTETDGCPVPSEEDRDGDGLLDWADDCPDEPGPPVTEGCPDADGDGMADAEDACPDEPGLPRHDGCPTPGDLDGDGVPDAEDECPEDWGLPEHGGCPDNDGDGIRDIDDRCPYEAGLPELDGCPDRDSDGVADPDDLRPDEPGGADHGGPDSDAPGDPETDEGDVFGDMGGWEPVFTVEFQALEFEVFDDYDEVYCYAGLAGGDMDRYGPFEIGDEERHWNISAELGSRFVPVGGESLHVEAECWASNIYIEPPPEEPPEEGVVFEAGGWGTVWDLGAFTREHPRDPDWLGHVIPVRSDPGPDGHSFEIQYRICEGSCEEAAYPPPLIHTVYYPMGQPRMAWSWAGDRSMITGFNVYVNDSLVRTVGSDLTSIVVPTEPSCGERLEYEMTAFSGHPYSPDRESPRSNTWVLEGEPCPLTLRVTFDTLHTHNLPDDYEGTAVGPIYGNFIATGSSGTEELHFDGAYCYSGPFSCFPVPVPCQGLGLGRHSHYSVARLLGWIRTEIAECPFSGCRPEASFYAPDSNSVTVELDRDDDLTIEAIILDADACLVETDTLLNDRVTIDGEVISARHGEYAHGVRYPLLGNECNLDVYVELLGGAP